MADDQNPPGEAGPPDDQIPRIESFFAEKGARTACPICTNPTWALLESQNATAILPTSNVIAIGGAMRGHALYAFTCRNCGYVKLHFRAVVDREVDLRFIPAGPEPAEEAGGDGKSET